MQDPEYHAEGDVWTHTRMVCDRLVELPEWQALDGVSREVVFAAALLHDVSKPETTREEDGHIRHPNHSLRGATTARRLLWELGVPFEHRERVAGLIRFHQAPFFLVDDRESLRKAARLSWVTRCDHLALLARADGLGRICADGQRIQDNITLFEEYCREQGCLDRPWPFASDHSRYLYFRTEGRDPAYKAYDDTQGEAVLMSGLPGAGKSHWVKDNLDVPEISLDDLRAELKLRPGENSSEVFSRARERARGYLRAGTRFVWNATNLSRDLRGRVLDLFALYNPRVRIVYVESSCTRLARQNRERDAAVPEGVLARMLQAWDVPDRTEAHQVDYVLLG
jgi:putative nucleotidyltransferase with HDIG domain